MNETELDKTSPATDGELLTRFVTNADQASFEELVRRHSAMVLAVCRSSLSGSGDVDDAAQAVFLTLAQKAPALVNHAAVAGWLHRVAWYVAIRAARDRVCPFGVAEAAIGLAHPEENLGVRFVRLVTRHCLRLGKHGDGAIELAPLQVDEIKHLRVSVYFLEHCVTCL